MRWATAGAAGLAGLLMAAAGLAGRDREAVVAGAVLLAVAGRAARPWRWDRPGLALVGILCVNTLVWMVPAGVSNIAHRERLSTVALPLVLAGLAAAGCTGSVLLLAGRHSSAWLAIPGSVGAGVVAAGLVAAAVSGDGAGKAGPAGELVVETRDLRFSARELRARPGEVTVVVTNRDLFWHTFTVTDLGANVAVPTGGTRRLTFTAGPGTYRFTCTIPGHERFMEGNLIVA